jgi:hypothetical protein
MCVLQVNQSRDILNKIDYLQENSCGREMESYFQCMKSNNYENLKCLGFYTRFNGKRKREFKLEFVWKKIKDKN